MRLRLHRGISTCVNYDWLARTRTQLSVLDARRARAIDLLRRPQGYHAVHCAGAQSTYCDICYECVMSAIVWRAPFQWSTGCNVLDSACELFRGPHVPADMAALLEQARLRERRSLQDAMVHSSLAWPVRPPLLAPGKRVITHYLASMQCEDAHVCLVCAQRHAFSHYGATENI